MHKIVGLCYVIITAALAESTKLQLQCGAVNQATQEEVSIGSYDS